MRSNAVDGARPLGSAEAVPEVAPPWPELAGGRSWRALTLLAAAGSAAWLVACGLVWWRGHVGLGTGSYGATWGIAVANVLHLVGISHVGIGISAAVRVMGLGAHRSAARLAELVTVVALSTAVLQIAVDVGRPGRFLLATARYGRWHAPMVWSMTALTAYFLASAVYLYLSLRRDLAAMGAAPGAAGKVFRRLALGYVDAPESRRRHQAVLYGLALVLVPMMVAVHSVYGFFFGLLGARPGWFNPLQAPAFVLGAVVSGFSALLVLAALLRWAFGWRRALPDRTFRAFAAVLAFAVFLSLYFLFSEHLTAHYAGPAAERALSAELLAGSHAPLFWAAVTAGLLVPLAVLFLQSVGPDARVGWIAAAALAVNAAMWAKRYLLVVPSQLAPLLPGPRAAGYQPTSLELAVTFGAYPFAALLLLLFLRWLPLEESDGPLREAVGRERSSRGAAAARASLARWLLAAGLAAAGAFLVAWGLAGRGAEGAALRWLAGLALFAAIPLAICLVPDPVDAPASAEACP